MHERHDPRKIFNQGEGAGDSKGDVFEPERGTLLPTVEPVQREPDQPRRILATLLRLLLIADSIDPVRGA